MSGDAQGDLGAGAHLAPDVALNIHKKKENWMRFFRWIKGRLKVDYVKNIDKVFVNQEPCFSQN